MAKRLDDSSRDILEFRPDIHFIEPAVQDEEVRAQEEVVQLEDLLTKRRKVKQLGKAVNVLATAVQSLVDQKAKNLKIKLDPATDAAAILAMSRKFPGPDIDSTVITYDQYKQVKEDLRKLGDKIAKKTLIDPIDVLAEQSDAALAQLNLTSDRVSTMGGFNTSAAFDGSLRPELQDVAVLIPPINIPELQIDLICILINFIWKNFIKPTVVNAAPPVSWAFKGLPDQICDPGTIDLPGLFILGDSEIPDLLSGKAAKRAVEEAAGKAVKAGAGIL